MSILSLGHRRLWIEIHLDRTPDRASADIEGLYFDRQARKAALAERAAWELHHLSRTGWLR